MTQFDDSILILGGGFTGLFTALHLGQSDCPLPVRLIDRETRFIFKPLLYELMSGESPVNMVWPRYEDLLAHRDASFLLGNIEDIDLCKRRVSLDSGLEYSYRYLVLGLGDVTGYFGVPGAEDYAVSFRSAEDALDLAKRLRQQLQRAQQAETEAERRKLSTVAIVGAGPTGTELAATLADLLPQWYESLQGDPSELSVTVIQRGDEILKGAVGKNLRSTAEQALGKRNMPVELQLNASVTEVREGELVFEQDGVEKTVLAETIVWTAGSTTHPLIQSLPVKARDRRGRLEVTPTLQLAEFPEVFAGGDCSVNPKDPMPATAQVAYQQGEAIANNILADLAGKPMSPSKATLRGTLLKLGMEESVAALFDKFEIKGHLGEVVRHGTYINLLPTPARNLKVGSEWLSDELFEQVLNV